MLMFDRTFAEKHKIGVTLLQTASKWNIENSNIKGEGLAKDSYLWNAMGTLDVTDATKKVETVAMGKVAHITGLTAYSHEMDVLW